MTKIAHWAIAFVLGLLLSSAGFAPAGAQTVDCGNGSYCPAGNVCLMGGTCGERVQVPPGGTQTSTGSWCEPNFREHKYKPGVCLPVSYVDCTDGSICGPGYTCGTGPNALCQGPPPTGPDCGAGRCPAGRVCNSRGICVNLTYYQDCGNGVTCTRAQTCTQNGGCAYVGIGRMPQVPNRR